MKFVPKLLALAAVAASLTVQAFPIATAGTEGLLVIASGGEVTATYEGNSAAYSNDLYLENTGAFVFNNHANSPGDTVVLGDFAAGTELLFRLHVNNTGDDFFTGPGSRNPDGQAHARVQAEWMPGVTLVSFEDLYNGPFEFNDLSYSFTNSVSGVPEPESYALMALGLVALGVVARRRRQS